ncbi:MAG: condensation domain-containing protein, partial [Bacteroidota bacterium]
RQWGAFLKTYAGQRRVSHQQNYWKSVTDAYQALPVDHEIDDPEMADLQEYTLKLEASKTKALLQEVNAAYQTEIDDILLSALAKTLNEWSGQQSLVVGLEGHGREDLSEELDTSETIGWFTNLYPVKLTTDPQEKTGQLIRSIKEQLRSIPEKGMGYGLLRFLHPEELTRAALSGGRWDMVFNYLGQIDNARTARFAIANEKIGPAVSGTYPMVHKIEVDAMVVDGQLEVSWGYGQRQYDAKTIAQLAQQYLKNLEALIEHCVAQPAPTLTVSDYGLAPAVSNQALEAYLGGMINGQKRSTLIEDICPLSPTQEGILFHSMYDDGSSAYTEQHQFGFASPLQMDAFVQAWEYVFRNHSILRSSIVFGAFKIPVQCVYKQVDLPLTELDFSNFDSTKQASALADFLAEDQSRGFDFGQPPFLRLTYIKLANDDYRLVFTSHHILLDGWSLPVMMGELLNAYELLVTDQTLPALPEDRYADFIHFLNRQDKFAEEDFWREYMADFESPSLLPFARNVAHRNKGEGSTNEVSLLIDEAFTQKLKAFTKANRITSNTLFQGVWSILLSKYTSTADVTFGATVSGRPSQLEGAGDKVGLYINTLPLRVMLEDEQTIVEWLSAIQEGHTAARTYQYTGLNEIQHWMNFKGDLFDSILVFDNYPIEKLALEERTLAIKEIDLKASNNFLLSIDVAVGETLNLKFNYYEDLLAAHYVEMISDHFYHVLQQIVNGQTKTLAGIRLLSTTEEQRLLTGLNNTAVAYSKTQTVLDLWKEQVAQGPDRPALVCDDQQMTYAELDVQSDRLAAHLKTAYDLQADDLVGIMMDRSNWMVISILGILKAGAAYVPIDP